MKRLGAPLPGTVALRDVSDVASLGQRLEDPLVRQLQAMHRVASDGEVELALMGCVTALEWFLNATFPDLVRVTRRGERHVSSISGFLRSGHAELLDDEERRFLEELVALRNRATHGPPPVRAGDARASADALATVRRCLFGTLAVYRSINRAT
jgi:hypothetical protein